MQQQFDRETRKKMLPPESRYLLYEYQAQAIDRMYKQFESGFNSTPPEPYLGFAVSTAKHYETKNNTSSENKEMNFLRQKFLGVLAMPTGAGKTLITIAFLHCHPRPPHPRKIVRSAYMFQDQSCLTRIDYNLVVAPNVLYNQWHEHIVNACVDSSWIFVSEQKHLNMFVERLATHDKRQQPGVKNVLVSKTQFESLLKKHNFGTRYLPLRIVLDEADRANYPLFYADFVWFVSATAQNFFDLVTRPFGCGAHRNSFIGYLKHSALCLRSVHEFILNITPETIATEVVLPNYVGEVRTYLTMKPLELLRSCEEKTCHNKNWFDMYANYGCFGEDQNIVHCVQQYLQENPSLIYPSSFLILDYGHKRSKYEFMHMLVQQFGHKYGLYVNRKTVSDKIYSLDDLFELWQPEHQEHERNKAQYRPGIYIADPNVLDNQCDRWMKNNLKRIVSINREDTMVACLAKCLTQHLDPEHKLVCVFYYCKSEINNESRAKFYDELTVLLDEYTTDVYDFVEDGCGNKKRTLLAGEEKNPKKMKGGCKNKGNSNYCLVSLDNSRQYSQVELKAREGFERTVFFLNATHLSAGLNLQAADAAIYMGEFSAERIVQTHGRCHRAPRNKPLRVIRLMSRNDCGFAAPIDGQTWTPQIDEQRYYYTQSTYEHNRKAALIEAHRARANVDIEATTDSSH